MLDIEYDGLAERIQTVYASCSKVEQQHLRHILEEMSIHGYSQTLEQLWLADFKEVPVSIDQFICDPNYLGQTNRNGEAVYPFWKKSARDIFNHGNRYNEIVLSGATRIGKTSTMTLIMTYMLYRLMLYRDPHSYFKKKAVSRFTIGFANLTQELARGVCYREFNDTLKECPWFCLAGDTKILTNKGYIDIESCSTMEGIAVASLNDQGEVEYLQPERIQCTGHVTETIKLTLEDGTVIEGTADHPVMMSGGSYKCLGDITEGDDVLGLPHDTFVPLRGYEGYYEISRTGIVRNAETHQLMRVSSVEKANHRVAKPVYDVIGVPNNHNFIVKGNASDIVVHNCDHGIFSRSERNFYYIPEGDKIDIVAGSDATNFLGMQLWACLTGDVEILTDLGFRKLHELSGRSSIVAEFDYINHDVYYTLADVVLTKFVNQTVRIWFDDTHYIEGTSDHLILLDRGIYKPMGEITISDSIINLSSPGIGELLHPHRIDIVDYTESIPVFDVLNVVPYHNFLVRSGENSCIVVHNCAVDECNFAKSGVKDITLAKAHMKKLYDTINARISGTFRLNGEVYGKMITASSKNTDSDFLSDHIQTQLNAGNKSLYLVDEPQWKILPKEMFSDEVFHFTVGDRYKKGFVIPPENDDEEHIKQYEKEGYKVIEAPAELRKNFIADYDISLRDIAGISVVGAMGFITQEAITPCISTNRHNPFYTDIIQVGTKSNATIEEFFHLEAVPSNLKHCTLHIHLDLSESGDKTGMCGVCLDGNKVVEDFSGKRVSMPFFREVFSVAIQPPTGDRLSFQKVVNFLLWLRRNGFNICLVSTDQYQSSYLREVLNQQGFKTEKISVDRSDEPYIGLKNILYDQRIELVRNELRDVELIHLERHNGRVDHPAAHPDFPGGKGSKDISDCLCGACYTLVTSGAVTTSATNVAKAISTVNGSSFRSSNNSKNNMTMFNYPKVYR